MLFELHITDLDMSSGSVPVTWCLDKELIDLVKTYPNPQVVIATAPVDCTLDQRETRYVVPLKDMMAYVSFRHPGKNRIYAYLIPVKTSDILNKFDGRYMTSIFNEDGTYSKYVAGSTDSIEESLQGFTYAAPLEVDVPKEYFGKEPAPWEKAWVLWLLRDKGIDQCAFRKRRLLAYTPFLQPLLMLFNLIFRFVYALIELLLGSKDFTLKYLLHPLTYSTHVVGANFLEFEKGCLFVRPVPAKWKDNGPKSFKEDFSYCIQRFWALPFMPPIFASLATITIYNKWLYVLAGIVTMIVIFLLVGVFASGAAKAFFDWLFNLVSEAGGENDLEEMICTGEPVRKPKRRSVKLRYLALKSKVCKPFAG